MARPMSSSQGTEGRWEPQSLPQELLLRKALLCPEQCHLNNTELPKFTLQDRDKIRLTSVCKQQLWVSTGVNKSSGHHLEQPPCSSAASLHNLGQAQERCSCLLKHYKARPTCLITAFNNTLLTLLKVNAYIMCILITYLTANNMGVLIGTKPYLVAEMSLWRINFKASSCRHASKPVFQITSCYPTAQLSSVLQETENIVRHFSLDCLVVSRLSCFKPLAGKRKLY